MEKLEQMIEMSWEVGHVTNEWLCYSLKNGIFFTVEEALDKQVLENDIFKKRFFFLANDFNMWRVSFYSRMVLLNPKCILKSRPILYLFFSVF